MAIIPCKYCNSSETKEEKMGFYGASYTEIVHNPDCILVRQKHANPPDTCSILRRSGKYDRK